LAQPLLATLPQGGQMIATDVVGVFLVPMKVALMVAFLIALPYVLYQVWAFVAPGLYAHEKRLALPLVAASVLLFFIGMAFAYFLVFPTVFGFMATVAPAGVAWMTDIEKYLSFVLTTFIAFGVTFEVPVVVLVLVYAGIVDLARLREWRPYVIVGAFVVAAVFTPPDVISQLMMAIPLCLLFELGLFLARVSSAGAQRALPRVISRLRKRRSTRPPSGRPCRPRRWIRQSRGSAASRSLTASRMPDRPDKLRKAISRARQW
jgi:sec-independent protein translocase protein TatC